MGPLGWIPPELREPEVQKEHENICNAAPKFTLARPTVPKGTKIILNDFLAKPEVVADNGGEIFTGFHQLTGSCVGVSEGDNIAVLSAIQRMLADEPTIAMIPWWGFPYGRSRFKSGMRTKGEGSVCSIMGRVVAEEGCFSINDPNFKGITFKKDDGWYVPANVEMDWSDGDETLVTQYLDLAKHYPVGSVSPIENIDDLCAGIINGYPCNNGCNYFIGHGRIKSSPGGDYVTGEYDGRGGHATNYTAYWEHPNDGPLLGYWNQWPTSTYPKDPAGLHRCMAWTPEAKAAQLFRLGGNGGETMLWSHLKYLPAQPKVLDWSMI